MDASKVTVLVTGGGGYVGSHACVDLLKNGYNVVVVDNCANCHKDEHVSQPESLIRAQILAGRQLKFYQVDLLNKTQLEKPFSEQKIDCVMHFAALKSVNESCCKPLQYYKNNISGTINLLEVMEKYNCTVLIYSSSATVYGDPEKLPLTEDEITGLGCTNPYGKSKFMVEEIMKDLCKYVQKWRIISLRYFNPVGAHESGVIGEDPAGIPNNLMPYVAQVAVGKLDKVHVFGGNYNTKDGTGVRDYIHIADLIDGHIKALEKLLQGKQGYSTYNLGTGKGYSVLEVIKCFSEIAKKEIKYEIVGRRPGDIAACYCDASLALRDLGWVASRDLTDMCASSWKWQKSNPNGYDRMRTTTCLLHTPNKINALLNYITAKELCKMEKKLKLDELAKLAQLNRAVELEKLSRMRQILMCLELVRSNAVCKKSLMHNTLPVR